MPRSKTAPIRDHHLGSDAGDGMVYARMDRTGDIYRIRRTQLTFAENAGLNTLLDRFVSPVGCRHAVTGARDNG